MQFVPDGLSPDGEELLEMLSSANLDVGLDANDANPGVNSPDLSLHAFMSTYLKTVRSGSAVKCYSLQGMRKQRTMGIPQTDKKPLILTRKRGDSETGLKVSVFAWLLNIA